MHGLLAVLMGGLAVAPAPGTFEGKFFSGAGDAEYLQLLDISGRMFAPDPEFQNMVRQYLSQLDAKYGEVLDGAKEEIRTIFGKTA